MTTRRLRVRSLAKINLDLRVLHKRPDGFHELRTIFQTISLADTLEMEYRPGRTRIELKSNLNISDNIVVKAADLVLRATRSTGRVGFVLKKRIPLGAGLGGGSSNAAAVLLGLPALLGKPLSLPRLAELAADLGSDVPFFLLGGAAVGLGRGIEIYPLPDFGTRPVLLITPGIHSSTRDAYAALRRKPKNQMADSKLNDFQWVAWQGSNNFKNDFETVVFRYHPQLKSIKGKLLEFGARPALMSGSGSSVFGVFEEGQARDRAEHWFRKEWFRKEFAGNQVHRVSMVSRRRYQALWRRQLTGCGNRDLGSALWPPQNRYAK
jgi:4-diphosphocytidyl-2-C-methyl-D-erythritol kinase